MMTKAYSLLIVCAIGTAVTAPISCAKHPVRFKAPSDAGPDTGVSDADADADSGPLSDAGGDAEIFSLEGTWAVLAILDGNVNVFFLGAPVPFALTAEALTLIKITAESDHYLGRTEVCDLSLTTEPVGGVDMDITMPPALVENIEPFDVAWYADGNEVSSGQFIILFGMKSSAVDPATDPMPKPGESDPRVFDQDKDGNVGVTINVEATVPGVGEGSYAGDLYVVLRHLMTLQGRLESADSGAGLCTWSEDLVKLGQSNDVFAAVTPKIKASNAPKASSYAMVRIDSGLTCADVNSQKATLFK